MFWDPGTWVCMVSIDFGDGKKKNGVCRCFMVVESGVRICFFWLPRHLGAGVY